MAFLTITKGMDTITLDVETESARELEPERVGSTTRSFAGPFRSDVEEFRGWAVVAVNLTQDDYDDLRDMVKNAAQVSIAGDALGDATPVTGIVELGEAPYVDDARGDDGFTRTVALTIKQG